MNRQPTVWIIPEVGTVHYYPGDNAVRCGVTSAAHVAARPRPVPGRDLRHPARPLRSAWTTPRVGTSSTARFCRKCFPAAGIEARPAVLGTGRQCRLRAGDLPDPHRRRRARDRRPLGRGRGALHAAGHGLWAEEQGQAHRLPRRPSPPTTSAWTPWAPRRKGCTSTTSMPPPDYPIAGVPGVREGVQAAIQDRSRATRPRAI